MSAQKKIRPLYDKIVVEAHDQETTTPGGILIPDSADKEKPSKGRVIAKGDGKYSSDGKVQPLQVKIGDNILFGKYAGTSIKLDNKEFLIMREEDVMGIIEE